MNKTPNLLINGIKIGITFLLASLFFVSCRKPQELVYQKVQNFQIMGVGLSKSTVSLDIKLYNPNHFAVNLKEADIEVFVNERFVGKVNLNSTHYTIPKLDTFLMPVSVQVDIKNMIPDAIGLLFNKKIAIKLDGIIKAGKHGVYFPIPIKYEEMKEI